MEERQRVRRRERTEEGTKELPKATNPELKSLCKPLIQLWRALETTNPILQGLRKRLIPYPMPQKH